MNELFNPVEFEIAMSQSIQLHNEHNYRDALNASTYAFGMAPEGSSEQGRAARDTSANYERLEKFDAAERWAKRAFDIHNDIVISFLNDDETPSRESYRERSVSAMYLGASSLRGVIESKNEGDYKESFSMAAVNNMVLAWGDIKRAKKLAPKKLDRLIDQYEINLSRRVAMTESLVGKRSLGLAIGAKAVAFAFMSESPKMDTSNPNFSQKQRTQAKLKAFLGGVASFGVGLLSLKPGERPKIAFSIAGKVL